MKTACVLLHYRNLPDTLECLDSLHAAGAHAWKIFLVNNHARDGSSAILEERLRTLGFAHALLEPGYNSGFAGGCNLGARAALAEGCSHVVLLNNDTVVAGDFARTLEKATAAFPEDVLAGDVREPDQRPTHNVGKISPWTGRVRHIFDPDFRGGDGEGGIDFVSGCLMVVPAGVLARVGLFDDKLFMYCEDTDFCARIAKAGVRVRYVPSVRLWHKFKPGISRAGIPKEYYIQRNQVYLILRRGTSRQRALLPFWLAAMLAYKLFRRPGFFTQALRGVWDGALGRMGRRHAEKGD